MALGLADLKLAACKITRSILLTTSGSEHNQYRMEPEGEQTPLRRSLHSADAPSAAQAAAAGFISTESAARSFCTESAGSTYIDGDDVANLPLNSLHALYHGIPR